MTTTIVVNQSGHSVVKIKNLDKKGQKALKKAQRKLRAAQQARTIDELAIAIGMAQVALQKIRHQQTKKG